MLKLSFVFLVVALVAGALGFTGVAGVSATLAEGFFIGFLALFVITLIIGLATAKKLSRTLGGGTTQQGERPRNLLHR